ncbi:MAG: hypothetical protein IKX88_13635, partial [Thermoguttaceae bacterium]|nr:hypothetical protein [Thermoguttaceae bacterium]
GVLNKKDFFEKFFRKAPRVVDRRFNRALKPGWALLWSAGSALLFARRLSYLARKADCAFAHRRNRRRRLLFA